MTRLVLLVLLAACSGKGADTAEVDPDTDTDTDTETPVDADNDGSTADVDCDDEDELVFPGASELCDGQDNDCDDIVDEGFDADGDGQVPQWCGGGDCDDTRDDVFDGATEVPYDSIDQDCDGADLTDQDEDGYDSDIAGGTDCDDADPAVNTEGVEVPYDGIDQDCSGRDLTDIDEDGYSSDKVGGADCDDLDPDIKPGVSDLLGDGIDSDCNGTDGATMDLGDAGVTVVGNASWDDLLGYGVASCDLDGDGNDDLLVSAPFSESYLGRIGVFYGSGAASWSTDMTMADADAVFTASRYFLGFGLGCADVDGDGYDDVVSARGETDPYFGVDFGVLVWYGSASGFPSVTSDSSAIELSFDLGITVDGVGGYVVHSRNFSLGDIDGDGAAEILVNMYKGYSGEGLLTPYNGNQAIWVVPGARYTTDGQLSTVTSAQVFGDSFNSVFLVEVVPDFDGDGSADVFVGQPYYNPHHDLEWEIGSEDTGDTDLSPGEAYGAPGLASFVGGFMDGYSVADLAYASLLGGSTELAFGYALAIGDYDGDSLADAAISAPVDARFADAGGGIWFISDIKTVLEGGLMELDPATVVTSVVASDDAEANLGPILASTVDWDGDGADDLLALDYNGGAADQEQVWLLSGALATDKAERFVGDAAMLLWEAPAPGHSTGQRLLSADFDGDGRPDVAASAATWTEGKSLSGRVYVYLSSTYGW